MFKQNEGLLDRVIRALVGIVLLIAALWLNGILATIFFILGLILLVTAAIGYCGLYSVCHFNTLEKKTESAPLVSEPAVKVEANPVTKTETKIETNPIVESDIEEVTEPAVETYPLESEPAQTPSEPTPNTDRETVTNN